MERLKSKKLAAINIKEKDPILRKNDFTKNTIQP